MEAFVTDESLFYQRFVEDVRACADGRAPTAVREIERRVEAALEAAHDEREACWGRVVAAVAELLGTLDEPTLPPATRLRGFVHENADLAVPV